MVLFTLVALLGAGCSSDSPPRPEATRATATTTPASAQAKGVKFAECVRAHGVVDFPDPDSKGEFAYGVSVSPAIFTRAVEACKALKPPGALSSKRTPKEQSASLRFAKCVRAHGVKDFPDPVNGEPAINTEKIPSSNQPGGLTILNAAIDACKSLSGLAPGSQR